MSDRNGDVDDDVEYEDTVDYDDDTVVEEEYETVDYDENPSERGKWLSGVIALGGVWLVVAPFLFEMFAANFWNDILVGLALVALGGYNYYRRSNEELGSTAAAALAALLGLWLVVAPFVFGVTSVVGFWSDIIVGLLALLLGAYSAYEASDADTPAAVMG